MSYILDALKKSDRSRQLNTTHEMPYSHLYSKSSDETRWLKISVIIFSVVTIAVLAYFFLINEKFNPVEIVPALTNDSVAQTINSIPERVVALEPVVIQTQDSKQFVVPVELAPVQRSSLSDLTTANTGVPSPSTTKSSAKRGLQSNTSSTSTNSDFTGYENYRSVRSKYSLPDMHLDILMYHPELPKRKAYINMSAYRQGEDTKEGVEIMKIGKEGVLLRYSGHDFVLTAK